MMTRHATGKMYWEGNRTVGGAPDGKWILWEENSWGEKIRAALVEWWDNGRCLGGKEYCRNGDVFLYGPVRYQNMVLIDCK
jgi:hypothetical protein